jgi:acetyltransferase-like isoleucine patch superfamily enzyme
VNPIISKNIRVRHPEHFEVGVGSIVDDFCYFSTRVKVGRWSHIAAGCHVGGGQAHLFEFGDFSSLSAGVKIWCASDDFVNDVVTILPAGMTGVKQRAIEGDVHFGRATAVGSNSVVMPQNRVPEGTVIGALSFVPPRFDFKPWSVYAGTPVRRLGPRNQDAVLAQIEQIEAFLQRNVEDQ